MAVIVPRMSKRNRVNYYDILLETFQAEGVDSGQVTKIMEREPLSSSLIMQGCRPMPKFLQMLSNETGVSFKSLCLCVGYIFPLQYPPARTR